MRLLYLLVAGKEVRSLKLRLLCAPHDGSSMWPGVSASMASSTAFAIRTHIAFLFSVSFRVLSRASDIAFCNFAIAAFCGLSVPSTCWAVLVALFVQELLGCAVVCYSGSSFGSFAAFLAERSMGDFPAASRLSFSALGLVYEWAHLSRFLSIAS